jgi:leader peptidase (prepilin peptidase)/N-methyltransferase
MDVDAILNAIPGWTAWAPAVTIGIAAALAAWPLTHWSLRACDAPSAWWPAAWGALAGLLCGALTLAVLAHHGQETPEVRPSDIWWLLRPAFHASLIVLLVAATATDLRTYYILDAVTVSGIVIAVAAAALSGDLQLVHIWVDWNQEIPQIRGPYMPEWISRENGYPHLHGLAWSVAGLIAGGGVAWAARRLSSLMMGQEALGFGDVTLMAMIGAYLGWQPTLIVFLLAPLCALAAGVLTRLVSSKTYVPYGPFLSLAAVLVLFFWRRIWMFEITLTQGARPGDRTTVFALRRLFGDWQGLMILAGMLAGGIVLLLGLWRLYLAIPVPVRSLSLDQATSTDNRPGPTPADR